MKRNYTWNLRIKHKADNQVTVFTRDQEFSVGEPLSFDREYEHTTALEQSLGAFAADLINGFRTIAEKKRIDIDNVEATLEAELDNPLTYLDVVGEEGDPSIQRISLKVYVSSFDPEEEIKKVWREAQKRSPLYQTFQKCIEINLDLEITL